MKTFDKVYTLVQKVPKGKVTTYGEIGRVLRLNPRVVGYALHANPSNDTTPCHRVVTIDGRVATGFAFGGEDIQKKLLEAEGVKFKDNSHVDIKDYFYSFKT